MGEGCQVQVHTWTLLTMVAGSGHLDSTRGVLAHRFPQYSLRYHLGEHGPTREAYARPV